MPLCVHHPDSVKKENLDIGFRQGGCVFSHKGDTTSDNIEIVVGCLYVHSPL